MESSKRLRENIQQTMAQSNSDLNAQKNATEFAMRRRIHEAEQAKDELNWQKKQVTYIFHPKIDFCRNPKLLFCPSSFLRLILIT